jgi:hypothetical protein
MDSYNSLVAGGDDPGFRDGGFVSARFDRPSGMALDGKGTRLFVADPGNNRIRVVHLDEQNRVETLAGSGSAGKADGPLAQASFNSPTLVVSLSSDRLAVYDSGNGLLRFLDLKTGIVSTAPEVPQGPVWDLVYRSEDDSLYFTEPTAHLLQRLDVKTGKIGTLLSNDPKIVAPRALCVEGDRLDVSDATTSAIFKLKIGSGPVTTPGLEDLGKGSGVLRLGFSDGRLYALQEGNQPFVQIAPFYRPVSLATPWGFCLENGNPGYGSLLSFTGDRGGWFIPAPGEPRRFLMTGQSSYSHAIFGIQDLDFGDRWTARSIVDKNDIFPDFNYPTIKPPRTFRILVVGDSRAVFAMTPDPFEATQKPGYSLDAHILASSRVSSFPKQLEFLLNARTSLKGGDIHFEVLTLARPGQSTPFFMPFDVPAAVQKYSVDLIMVLAAPQEAEGFIYYFERPLDHDGIPVAQVDPEYLLKPYKDRIPGGISRDLYERCQKNGWAREVSPTRLAFSSFGDLLGVGDLGVRKDLLELTGRPFQVLADRLNKSKGTDGKSPRYLIFYVPGQDHGGATEEEHESFWKDLGQEEHWPVLDLTEPFDALKVSFYPVNENCCHFHYTAFGHSLIATLLEHYLVEQGRVPFTSKGPEK